MKSVTQTNYIKLVQSGLKAKHTILTHISYQTILDLLESDKNCLFSDEVKNKIIKLLENEL